MKKQTHKTLYPAKEDITFKDFLLEEKQLLVLIILLIVITFFIIGCILTADYFRAETFYNYI